MNSRHNQLLNFVPGQMALHRTGKSYASSYQLAKRYAQKVHEPSMIFVFIEDGTLDVIGESSEDLLAYESIDVENGIYTFFDEHGKYLKPIFHSPNQKGKELLGLFRCSEVGSIQFSISSRRM